VALNVQPWHVLDKRKRRTRSLENHWMPAMVAWWGGFLFHSLFLLFLLHEIQVGRNVRVFFSCRYIYVLICLYIYIGKHKQNVMTAMAHAWIKL
jgi:hypothetical protein